jgi:predicted transposase/invertase (TIGR01784 family)
MPLFNKQEHELKNHFDKWLYFLKNLESFDHIPAILKEPIFEKAFSTLEEANLTKEQLEQYQKSLLTYWELKGVVDTAYDDGEKIGLEKGEKIGLEKGRKIEKLEIAKSLLDILDIETISLKTGLNMEEINQLK